MLPFCCNGLFFLFFFLTDYSYFKCKPNEKEQRCLAAQRFLELIIFTIIVMISTPLLPVKISTDFMPYFHFTRLATSMLYFLAATDNMWLFCINLFLHSGNELHAIYVFGEFNDTTTP